MDICKYINVLFKVTYQMYRTLPLPDTESADIRPSLW